MLFLMCGEKPVCIKCSLRSAAKMMWSTPSSSTSVGPRLTGNWVSTRMCILEKSLSHWYSLMRTMPAPSDQAADMCSLHSLLLSAARYGCPGCSCTLLVASILADYLVTAGLSCMLMTGAFLASTHCHPPRFSEYQDIHPGVPEYTQ
jgi:hypothetical protein